MPEAEINQSNSLVAELGKDSYCREILRFFARHPYARFEAQVLVKTLGLGDARRIRQTLDRLTGQEFLETSTGNGLFLYRLTRHEPAHSAVKTTLPLSKPRTGNVIERLGMVQLSLPLLACL